MPLPKGHGNQENKITLLHNYHTIAKSPAVTTKSARGPSSRLNQPFFIGKWSFRITLLVNQFRLTYVATRPN
jgi:hypothetical protein